MTHFNFYKMYVFMNMVITRVKHASPDMILTAFDEKFHEKKDELPPEACRPSKKLRKNNAGPDRIFCPGFFAGLDRTGFFVPDLFPDRTGFFVPDLFFGSDRTGPDRIIPGFSRNSTRIMSGDPFLTL